MRTRLFTLALTLIAILFAVIFCYLVIPPFLENPNVAAIAMQGFVNPISSAYAWDAILCWFVLLVWVLYELPKVKGGWIALLLGLMPGVAVGFAVYLVLRLRQKVDNA